MSLQFLLYIGATLCLALGVWGAIGTISYVHTAFFCRPELEALSRKDGNS